MIYDNNLFRNPYLPNLPQTYAPQMEIQKVNGEESTKAYSIGPNSSVILLDTNDPLIWVVTTDASGYKTIKPFTITPYIPDEPIKADEIKSQIDSISDRLNKLEEVVNRESYHEPSWKNKPGNANSFSNGRNGQGGAKSE